MRTHIHALAVVAATTLAGCAAAPYQGGVIYSGLTAPIDAPDNAPRCVKRGEATVTNILGLFSFGDAGVAAAKAHGGIQKISSVDVRFTQVLGLFSTSTTQVCGE